MEQKNDIIQLWLVAKRMTAMLEHQAEAELRSKLGLSLPIYTLMFTLQSNTYGLNQQEVAEHLGLAKSSVSRQIESAVAAGLVSVSPSAISRRENTVALTPAGEQLFAEADSIVCAIGPAAPSPQILEATAAVQRAIDLLSAPL